jgi:hypothetical protein
MEPAAHGAQNQAPHDTRRSQQEDQYWQCNSRVVGDVRLVEQDKHNEGGWPDDESERPGPEE